MTEVKSFFELRTWKEAHTLALELYRVSSRFPKEELYGLTSQIRRAAVSVPANIAEGMGRGSAKDLIRFLVNSRGSIQELLAELYIAVDLSYLAREEYETLRKRYEGLNAGINAHIQKLSAYTVSK